jgi:hypothetical protein
VNESRGDVLACIAIAVGLFAVTFPPALLWARAEHLTPRWLRDAPLTVTAFLLICTPTQGTTR